MAEKTAHAFIAFETTQFILAFVLLMLCNTQGAFRQPPTKTALSFIFMCFLKMTFIFLMIRRDPNQTAGLPF